MAGSHSSREQKLDLVFQHIRNIPDFPVKGIVFKDICPILKEPKALAAVIDLFEEHVRQNYPNTELIVASHVECSERHKIMAVRASSFGNVHIDYQNVGEKRTLWDFDYGMIVGLDARGFLFGPLLAQRLGIGFVLVRKKGKLPGPTVSVSYTLEYATAEAEIQADAVEPGQKVLIIDDLLATGGTLHAACELMKKQKAQVLGCLVVIELKDLHGAERLSVPIFSLLQN